MVEFWMGWEFRLKMNDGNYVKTFLQQLAVGAIQTQMINSYNVRGVVREYDSKEGWYPMNGDYGITIIDVGYYKLESSNFEINDYSSI
jgi:hypothetical protein